MLAHLITQNTSEKCLIWLLIWSYLIPLYMIWHRAQPSHIHHPMSNVVCAHFLLPVSWSTLHHLLHPNACYYATCPTMSEVPTLVVHVCMDAPISYAHCAHIVQVYLEHPFGSATLWCRWDHLYTYKFGTFNCSHFSYLHTNGSLHSMVVPIMLTSLGVSWDQHAHLVGCSASICSMLATVFPTLNDCLPWQHPQELSVLKSHCLDLCARLWSAPPTTS